MTDEQVRRYARHILLPDVGGRGQVRLLAAACTVAVGPDHAAETCALMYLAAAGVGTIGLAGELDGAVSAAEQRDQPVYTRDDVGRPRGAALVAHLTALNPDVTVVPAPTVAGAPALELGAVPAWLGPATPRVAIALARGGAAATRLLAALYRTP